MSYLKGLGDVASTAIPWWCSPQMPQGGCTPVKGVCKPMNTGTLTLFQMLQRRINALRAKRKAALIEVDGRIGNDTVLALRSISTDPFSIVDCNTIGKNSLALVGALEAQMAAEGAAYVPDPSSSRPSVAQADGTVQHPPSRPQLSKTTMIVAAIGIGAVVALGSTKGKRR